MLTKKEQRLRRSRQTRARIAVQRVARLSVYRTNLHIYASVISDDGAKVLASASTAEADIRKDVPSFNARTVVGTNIDTFHKNPSYQRKLLSELKTTHKAKLVLGGRTFSLLLSPIDDAKNERLGYVVEWKDMTAELAVRERCAALGLSCVVLQPSTVIGVVAGRSYPLLGFPELPEIDVLLMPRQEEPPLGAGDRRALGEPREAADPAARRGARRPVAPARRRD